MGVFFVNDIDDTLDGLKTINELVNALVGFLGDRNNLRYLFVFVFC